MFLPRHYIVCYPTVVNISHNTFSPILVVSGDFDVLFKCCFVMFIYYTIIL